MAVIKPPRLKRGDLIGIVAPASPPATDDKLNSSISYLERQGFKVKLGKHIHARKGYLAGEDKERAEALGVDDYLVKSQVVIGDVVERIRHHLGLSAPASQ